MIRRFFRWVNRPSFQKVARPSRVVASAFKRGWNLLSANQITLISVALCVPMVMAFLSASLWGLVIGAAFMTVSIALDFCDGAVARAHEKESGRATPLTLEEELKFNWRKRLSYRGVTHLGRVLDPIGDKIRLFLVLWPLAFGYLDTTLLIVIAAIAVLLTALRPIKQWLKLGEIGSNKLGKMKLLVEIAGMYMLVFLPISPLYASIIDTVFLVTLMLAIGSFTIQIVNACVAYYRREKRPLPRGLSEIDLD